MREYCRVSPRFWFQGSGKRLRDDPEAQIVALYLLTCPTSTMLGLYYLPMPTLAHDLGMTVDKGGIAR